MNKLVKLLIPRLEFYYDNLCIADVPADALVLGGGAPVYERDYVEPKYFSEYKKFNMSSVLPPENIMRWLKI